MMLPPTLGAALLSSSWAGYYMWLDPELITLCIAHCDGITAIGVQIHNREDDNLKNYRECIGNDLS